MMPRIPYKYINSAINDIRLIHLFIFLKEIRFKVVEYNTTLSFPLYHLNSPSPESIPHSHNYTIFLLVSL